MSESFAVQGPVLMTQVIGSPDGGNGGEQLLGEIESSGLSIGWNRATLTERARLALHAILERNGGVTNRSFEMRHGSLVLQRCQMVAGRALSLSFDGSRRQRVR